MELLETVKMMESEDYEERAKIEEVNLEIKKEG